MSPCIPLRSLLSRKRLSAASPMSLSSFLGLVNCLYPSYSLDTGCSLGLVLALSVCRDFLMVCSSSGEVMGLILWTALGNGEILGLYWEILGLYWEILGV